jgi:hypothetical protein
MGNGEYLKEQLPREITSKSLTVIIHKDQRK